MQMSSQIGRRISYDFRLRAAGGRQGKSLVLMEERKMIETRTILLVDDEEIVSEVAGQMLEALGFQVIKAESGARALELYDRHGDQIDLVILDVTMQGMGGGETFDRLKLAHRDVRVLLSSGHSLDGEVGEILSRGCCGFIQKPFSLSRLLAAIEDILGKKRLP